MKILLFSTCVADEPRLQVLDRMLLAASRARSRIEAPHELRLLLLLQRTNARELAIECPKFVEVSSTSDIIPLSTARNRLLKPLLENGGFGADTIVAFPDDDCWYPQGVLERIIDRFNSNKQLDFFFCRYSSMPKGEQDVDFSHAAVAKISDVVRNASSNTIFLRGTVMAKIARFDETLGVGTPNGSAEDLDIALAAFGFARQSEFLDEAIIGHRDKNMALRSRYYRGGLIVLARYANRGAFREYLRKILVGVYLWLRGELTSRQLIGAFRASLQHTD